MVKQISCVTSLWQQMQHTVDTEHVFGQYHPSLAEIIPDNWRRFSFWHQVFVLAIFSCSLLIFQCCYQRLTPAAGAGLLLHTDLRTNVIGGSLCTHCVCQVPLKLDEFICVLHRRLCDLTIAHMYIVMATLKRHIVQP